MIVVNNVVANLVPSIVEYDPYVDVNDVLIDRIGSGSGWPPGALDYDVAHGASSTPRGNTITTLSIQ